MSFDMILGGASEGEGGSWSCIHFTLSCRRRHSAFIWNGKLVVWVVDGIACLVDIHCSLASIFFGLQCKRSWPILPFSLPPSFALEGPQREENIHESACLLNRAAAALKVALNKWMNETGIHEERGEREIEDFDIGPATTVSTVWPFQFHANYESYTALPAAEGSFVLSFDLNRDEAVTTGEEIDGRRRTESRRDDTPSKAASIQGWMVARCKTYFRYVHRWRSITPSAAEWCQPELPKHSCCLMTRFRRFWLGCS